MDFVIWLPISTDRKNNSYDSIIIIVNQIINMVYYKLVSIIINATSLVEVIINVLMKYHGL